MRNVSDAYMQVVSGSVIPKCEPRITLKYKDANDAEQVIVWSAKDIKDFDYKQGADPLNRTLPFIEATWTELYYGDLDENNEPAKYNNVGQFGLVKIEFVQDLTVGLNQWKSLYNQGVKWSDLLSITWKNVLRNKQQEIIEMPKLFLMAKPELKNNTITWKAVDLLSLMTTQQSKNFGGIQTASGGKVILDPMYIISNLILQERSQFLSSPYVLNSITETVDWLCGEDNEFRPVLTKPIWVNGKTKDILLYFANLLECALKFDGNTIKTTYSLINQTGKIPFTSHTLKKHPVLTRNPNVSSYQGSVHKIVVNTEKPYEVYPSIVEKSGYSLAYWYFDGLGVPEGSDILHNYKYAVCDADNVSLYNPPMKVYPLQEEKTEQIINLNQQGETFIENNPLNMYDYTEEGFGEKRVRFVKRYFSDNAYSIEFEAFPNLAFEVGDIVGIETNLKSQGQSVIKNAVIVEMELNYNGALIERIKAHEVMS